MKSIYEVEVLTASGGKVSLNKYRNNILLVVNVASKCGFTKQYVDLQALYEKYHSKGLEILAFPCNQFLFQEPGSNEDIIKNIRDKYGVTFPIFAKIDVRGSKQADIYHWIQDNYDGNKLLPLIPWNFTKFLINTDGTLYKRYVPTDEFKVLEKDISTLCLVNG